MKQKLKNKDPPTQPDPAAILLATLDESNQKLRWLFVQLLQAKWNGVSVELFVNHNCAQK